MVEIVNVVASGALDVELDLKRLADDIGEPVARYDPDKYPGMYLRFEEDAPLITVYRTGKFIITGADSEDESYSLRKQFLNLFSDMGVIEEPEDEWFAIQNYVCTAELGQSLNLNALAIGLGLEKTEYEPEQFPGLIHRPEGADGVVLLFATGKVVITGCRTLEAAGDIFVDLTETVSELL
ncbi:TATA-box-binding protein [Halobacterium sp. BOL4-2]|uniref:TATA-box-binding protein n=1 Tax=Halobacterium sp. BOL4-2 TaxID=2810537 RepID=UPI001E4E70A9|nr:TATA-box-binding protein [Halobacterium sp. BOL4-2]UDF60535.1 TATA-box-binding protein [Halobacterium sp. BOL4-2]